LERKIKAIPVPPFPAKAQKKARMAGRFEMFETYNPDQYKFSPDFRRQLKTRTKK